MSDIVLTTKDKADKKTAFKILLEFKKSDDITEYDLDRLLNYFAPPIPKNPKTVMEWVARAAGKKHVRDFLNYVHVKDAICYASNGHRLHKGVEVKWPDGVYDPKTLITVNTHNEWELFQRLMVKCPNSDSNLWKETKISSLPTKYVNSAVQVFFDWPDVEPDISFNAQYVLDAVGDSKIVDHAYIGRGNMFIENRFGMALINGISQKPFKGGNNA